MRGWVGWWWLWLGELGSCLRCSWGWWIWCWWIGRGLLRWLLGWELIWCWCWCLGRMICMISLVWRCIFGCIKFRCGCWGCWSLCCCFCMGGGFLIMMLDWCCIGGDWILWWGGWLWWCRRGRGRLRMRRWIGCIVSMWGNWRRCGRGIRMCLWLVEGGRWIFWSSFFFWGFCEVYRYLFFLVWWFGCGS